MADPLASPDDLASYWRPLTDGEFDVAFSLIAVASVLIRRRVPDVDARIASGDLDTAVVTYVVSQMVRSAVEGASRPADAKSMSNTMGPYSQSVTYEAASHLAVTDALAALLLDASPVEIGSARLGGARIPAAPEWACSRTPGWPSLPGWRRSS